MTNVAEEILTTVENAKSLGLLPEEFERIKAAGAEVVKEPYEIEGMWIATFADPDGNYFQLMSPWVQK